MRIEFFTPESHADCACAEGDHIKITASKYPFPTVCSISQSTDWFQSISRTLKWNERERQKSFVVVEESPLKKKHHRQESAQSSESVSPSSENAVEDEEPDDEEDTSEDEEDEKYDIDDLSSSEQSPKDKESPAQNEICPVNEAVGQQKVAQLAEEEERHRRRAEVAARALAQGSPILRKTRRSRSRSGVHSGVETPDRFAGPHPHPPRLSPRHVQFSGGALLSENASSASLTDAAPDLHARGDRGVRDEIHSPRGLNGHRDRIPRDREIGGESLRTPTASLEATRRRRSRDRPAPQVEFDGDTYPRRAFACWGQDESDSATSDSDL